MKKAQSNPKMKIKNKVQLQYEACGYAPKHKMTMFELAKFSLRQGRGDDDATNPHWKFSYDQHVQRILTTKPKVDTSSPMVCRNLYSSPAKFNRSITNFVRIERENAMMLMRIATIMKGPGTLDNRLSLKSHSINIKSKARELSLLRIAFDNLEMWKRIQKVRPTYDRKEQLKDFLRMEHIMELTSYYPLFWKVAPNTAYEALREQATNNARINPRPKVYLQLETDDEALGEIVIELRADIVPMTAENFRCLCTGEMGMSYKCSEIHRIVPDILCQGGDVLGKDGHGNKSIYGDYFPDENFRLRHKEPGMVSMANSGKDTNGSQFIITSTKLGALDKVNVVVGKVLSGLDILKSLEKLVTPAGSLKKKVWIANCGSVDDGIRTDPNAGGQEEEYAEDYEESEAEEDEGRPPSTREYEAGMESEEEAGSESEG